MAAMRRILVLALAAAVVLGPGWMAGAPAQEDARARLSIPSPVVFASHPPKAEAWQSRGFFGSGQSKITLF